MGIGGIVAMDVRSALAGIQLRGYTVIAGLGGRPITKKSLHALLEDAVADRLGHLTFLDLDQHLIDRELERQRLHRRSGPEAENILRDVGTVAAGSI